MTKRIFRSLCIVALTVFLSSLVIILGLLYDYFTLMQHKDIKSKLALASHGLDISGAQYLEGLAPSDLRITWIDTDGTVLYDSDVNASGMENHGERQEIKDAFELGYGESIRYSTTILERQLYSAKRLRDGSVLRLSGTQSTALAFVLQMLQPIAVLLIVALILSMILSSQLAKQIVKPLNSLNLDEPLTNDNYEELAPLLTRIEHQHRHIKKQMSELKRRQDEFETVTGSMTEGLILLSNNGIILSINKSAALLFGTDKSCIGKHMLTIDRSLAIQEILHLANEGSKAEKVVSMAGGKYQLSTSPVITDGVVSGAALLVFDVTEKMNAEQRRREFTANVSHELRTPLHSISGHAELLKNGLVKPEDMTRFTDQIYTEAQRMTSLVDSIIRLSRLDEGTEDMDWGQVDLLSAAQEAVSGLESMAKERGVSMNLEGESIPINGVHQLITGIIYNLCDNAIKYNREGGRVDIQVSRTPFNAVLSVKDTGIGIPEPHLNRVFERFYRVGKSHFKEVSGTGLGLSIVKHAVRLHDATIELDSEEGVGTTVTVTFPILK